VNTQEIKMDFEPPSRPGATWSFQVIMDGTLGIATGVAFTRRECEVACYRAVGEFFSGLARERLLQSENYKVSEEDDNVMNRGPIV
jgi:hypothetical protein